MTIQDFKRKYGTKTTSIFLKDLVFRCRTEEERKLVQEISSDLEKALELVKE